MRRLVVALRTTMMDAFIMFWCNACQAGARRCSCAECEQVQQVGTVLRRYERILANDGLFSHQRCAAYHATPNAMQLTDLRPKAFRRPRRSAGLQRGKDLAVRVGRQQ